MKIVVSKLLSKVDEVLEIKVIDIPKDEKIIIKAQMIDGRGNQWNSKGIYYSGQSDEINLSKDESIGGSYKGIEPMGLFWSMTSKKKWSVFYSTDLKPLNYQITACVGNNKDEITIKRIFIDEDTIVENVNNNLLQGSYFYHKNIKPKGIIVLFGGSEGSNDLMRAAILAAHGYNVFAAYFFGIGSLPEELVFVPLEFFEEILKFIGERNALKKMPLTLIGASRGAELALLLGTFYKEINQIILISGSSYVFQGNSRERFASSWTMNGQELPYIASSFNILDMLSVMIKSFKKEPFDSIKYFRLAIKKEKFIEKKRIKSELFRGRLVLIYGEQDKLWTSKDMAEVIEKSRNIYELKDQTIKFNYKNAGHVFQVPYMPMFQPITIMNGLIYDMGGTVEENFKASEDSHFNILKLLENV